MLTRQKCLCAGHIQLASSSANSEGLLYCNPPSMYAMPGDGFAITISLKKDGTALVARAASQIAHLLGLTPSPEYERNTVGVPLAMTAFVATTKVGQT